MVKLSKIARVNALDAYFPKNQETAVSAEIDFELVRDSKINQLATWPNKINEFQKHIKVLKIHNLCNSPPENGFVDKLIL